MPAQLPLALRLREGLTFETLEPGSNATPLALARELARGEPGQLYLHGARGSGRTHVLTAAIIEAEQRGRRACLLPGSELAMLTPDLLEAFDHFELVAVDDIDALAGLRHWEEALFHLYNRLVAERRSLLFTAADVPAASGFLLPDLTSRLAAGPVFRLQPLSDADLIGLLCHRAASRGLHLSEEVAAFIVSRRERTPAALMATLDRLDEHALARQRRLTIPLVKEALGW